MNGPDFEWDLKSGQMATILSKNIWNLDTNVWFSNGEDHIYSSDPSKTWPIEIWFSKSPYLDCLQILNGWIYYPYCIGRNKKIVIPFCPNLPLLFSFWIVYLSFAHLLYLHPLHSLLLPHHFDPCWNLNRKLEGGYLKYTGRIH